MENCIRNARSKKESLRKVYCWKGRTESKAETRLKGRGQSFGSARIWSTILPPASRLICKDRDSGGWGLGRGFPGLRLGNFAVDFAKWRGGWGVAPRGNRKHRSMYARTSTTKMHGGLRGRWSKWSTLHLALFQRSLFEQNSLVNGCDLRHFVDSLEYPSIDTPVLFRLSCILRFYSNSCSPSFSVARWCLDLWYSRRYFIGYILNGSLINEKSSSWKLTMRFSLFLSVRRRERLKLILRIISPLTLCNYTLLTLRKLTLLLRKCWLTKMSLLNTLSCLRWWFVIMIVYWQFVGIYWINIDYSKYKICKSRREIIFLRLLLLFNSFRLRI